MIKKHQCELKDDRDIFLPRVPPYASTFTKFLRSYKKFITISERNPHTHFHMRSHSAILKEKQRHMQECNPYIIHPFSTYALWQETILCIFWLIVFFIDPFLLAFLKEEYLDTHFNLYNSLYLIIDFISIYIIVSNFFIGYTVYATKEIVLDQNQIIKKYVKSFFIFDLMGGISHVAIMFNPWIAHIKQAILFYIAHIHNFRLVRIKTTCQYFFNVLQRMGFKDSTCICIGLLVLTFYITHWSACLMYVIPKHILFDGKSLEDSWLLQHSKNHSLGKHYLESMLFTSSHFFGACKGHYVTRNPVEQIFLSIIMIMGYVYYVCVLAAIFLLSGSVNASESKYEELLQDFREYAASKKLPVSLRKRTIAYLEYKFQQRFFEEETIVSTLSDHLRNEVLLHGCKNLLENVAIFVDISKKGQGRILTFLQQEVFLPNDIILDPNMISDKVYFITYGTVAVYLKDGRELNHLEDGDYFGEVMILMREKNIEPFLSVVAIDVTETYYITHKQLRQCLDHDKKIVKKLNETAEKRLGFYREQLNTHEDEKKQEDILSALKRGEILEEGRRRL